MDEVLLIFITVTQSNFFTHPRPILFKYGETGDANGSFCNIPDKIWNDLPLQTEAYACLETFSRDLDQLDRQQIPFVQEHISACQAF